MDLLISRCLMISLILLLNCSIFVFSDSTTTSPASPSLPLSRGNSSDAVSSSEDSSTSSEEEEDIYMPVIECSPNVTIEEVFLENKITPDLGLNFSDHYMALIEIEYADGLPVHCGNELTPNQTALEPVTFNYHGGWYEHYSVVMIDPDAAKEKGTVLHWMLVNVPGSNYTEGEISCPYHGPKPTVNSGPHRYITLIYLQQDSGPVTFKNFSENRYNFNLTSWVAENSLQGPVFGNFFTAQNKSPPK